MYKILAMLFSQEHLKKHLFIVQLQLGWLVVRIPRFTEYVWDEINFDPFKKLRNKIFQDVCNNFTLNFFTDMTILKFHAFFVNGFENSERDSLISIVDCTYFVVTLVTWPFLSILSFIQKYILSHDQHVRSRPLQRSCTFTSLLVLVYRWRHD